MINNKLHLKYHCPIDVTLKTIGGKWKPIILHHLLSGNKQFGDMTKLIPNINQKMLGQQLRELEGDLLINKTVYVEALPRVEYSITDYGKTLEKVLDGLRNWGLGHIEKNGLKIEK